MSKAKHKSITSAVKVSSPRRKRVTQSNDALPKPWPATTFVIAAQPTERDRALANAFCELETQVHDLRNMACILEVIADDTVLKSQDETAKRIKVRMPDLARYEVHVWTETQARAINSAVWQLISSTRDMYIQWHRSFDAAGRAIGGAA
jgi:hypothetical protein